MSLKIIIFATSADCNEILHDMIFHLGLYCLQYKKRTPAEYFIMFIVLKNGWLSVAVEMGLGM